MDSELPDLDENVSFIVEDGASVGPLPMRAIVESVTSGERSASSLVWWAGATDWVRFDSLSELQDAAVPEDTAVEPDSRWTTVETDPTAVQASPPDEAEVAAATPAADPFAEVSPTPIAQPAEPAAAMNLPTRGSGADEKDLPRPALTGLFSSGARNAPTDPEADQQSAPSPDALDAILAARQSLESVGARIEALSSATRRSMSPEEAQRFEAEAASAAAGQLAVANDVPLATTAAQATETVPEVEPSPAPLDDLNAAAPGAWTDVADQPQSAVAEPVANVGADAGRAELTARFDEMVRKSVAHQRRIEWIMRVDELLLSACITAIADSGFTAIDLKSHESEHRVLFNHNDDSRRVRLELSPVETVSESFGRHVRFGLSWGRDVANPDQAFETVRQQTSDAEVPPGVVTTEADMANSSVSTHVELILAADDFVKDDYSVDRVSLDSSIAATLHALEGRWQQLFA